MANTEAKNNPKEPWQIRVESILNDPEYVALDDKVKKLDAEISIASSDQFRYKKGSKMRLAAEARFNELYSEREQAYAQMSAIEERLGEP